MWNEDYDGDFTDVSQRRGSYAKNDVGTLGKIVCGAFCVFILVACVVMALGLNGCAGKASRIGEAAKGIAWDVSGAGNEVRAAELSWQREAMPDPALAQATPAATSKLARVKNSDTEARRHRESTTIDPVMPVRASATETVYGGASPKSATVPLPALVRTPVPSPATDPGTAAARRGFLPPMFYSGYPDP